MDGFIRNNCDNKTAVLLPDFTAHDLYYKLKREKRNAFLGNDLNLGMSFGVWFNRRLNPMVLKRMQGLYSSGLFDWWTKIYVDVLPKLQGGFIHSENDWKPSDIQGKIVVVF